MKKTILAVFVCAPLVGITVQNLAHAEQSCDRSKFESTPTSRFEINQADGVVLDKHTKLTWKICAEGQRYLAGNCSGSAHRFTFNEAFENFGRESSDWRLPSMDELDSIVEWRCQYPALNERIFPDSPDASFWSGSVSVDDSSYAWLMFFSIGSSTTVAKTNSAAIRLVRGTPWIDAIKEEERRQEKLVLQKRQADALEELRLREEQAKLDVERRRAIAPNILRSMSKDEFCASYGKGMREGYVAGIGSLPDIMKLLKKELTRRKIKLDDSMARKGHIKLGISECQLYASWGEPEDQNQTVGSWGVHTQHVYGLGSYVYTENGRVTSWQQ